MCTSGGAAGARDPATRVLETLEVARGVSHGPVRFTHNGVETIGGYLARPTGAAASAGPTGRPAVLVVAGNRITEEYIPNTCAALALAGFVALAPDVFHPLSEDARTAAEIDQALAHHTELDKQADLFAGVNYLRALPGVRPDGLGLVGFCSGGRLALLFGARSREVDAVVAFHPAPVRPDELRRLRAPVLLHHGTADAAVAHAASQDTERALAANGVAVRLHLYPGADHGFLAYTRPFYRPDQAARAWRRTVAFLRRHLTAPAPAGHP